MDHNGERNSFEQLLRPLRRELNDDLAAAILRIQADEDTQRRYDSLAERNSEGCLTLEEQQELESLVRANLMVSVLKAEARGYLLHQPAA